jgi:hypothetical protein
MQARLLNKIIFFAIFLLAFCQSAYSQIDRKQIKMADSLFQANRLLEAEKIYRLNLPKALAESENIKLKLAFISKAKNDWLSELYFLSSIHAKQNSLAIAKRLEEIGVKRNLTGYEVTLIDQIEWIYFALFPYVTSILVGLGLYGVLILIFKFRRRRRLRKVQIIYLMAYFSFVLLFANFPGFLRYGIITSEKAYLREFASAAAPVKKILQKGNRINYWNTKDVWVTCLKDGQIGYIKVNDYSPID